MQPCSYESRLARAGEVSGGVFVSVGFQPHEEGARSPGAGEPSRGMALIRAPAKQGDHV